MADPLTIQELIRNDVGSLSERMWCLQLRMQIGDVHVTYSPLTLGEALRMARSDIERGYPVLRIVGENKILSEADVHRSLGIAPPPTRN